MIENEIAKLEKLLQPLCSSCLYPSSASLCSSLVSVSAAFAIRPLLGKRSYGPSLARKRYARRRPPSRLRGKTFIGAPTTAVNAPRQNLHWRADDRRQRSAAKPSLARRRPPSRLRGKTLIGVRRTAVQLPWQNLRQQPRQNVLGAAQVLAYLTHGARLIVSPQCCHQPPVLGI